MQASAPVGVGEGVIVAVGISVAVFVADEVDDTVGVNVEVGMAVGMAVEVLIGVGNAPHRRRYMLAEILSPNALTPLGHSTTLMSPALS